MKKRKKIVARPVVVVDDDFDFLGEDTDSGNGHSKKVETKTKKVKAEIVEDRGVSTIARCSGCRIEFTKEELDEAGKIGHCPACNTTIPPQWKAHDITLSANWFDLRVLFNAAFERLSETGFAPVLERFAENVRALRPKGAPALTINEEYVEKSAEQGGAIEKRPLP